MRTVTRKLMLAFAALLLASTAVVGGTSNTPASAQASYDFYDWGWVQAYYGGVHLYMYDYCPYVATGKDKCRKMHYDHHIVAWGQVIPDSDELPEAVWLGSIIPGQYNTWGAILDWVGAGAHAGWATGWWPGDDATTCPSGQQVCGLYSDGLGVFNVHSPYNSELGGNTAHARFYQSSVDCTLCTPDTARTVLY